MSIRRVNNTQVYHFATQVHTRRVTLGRLMELTSSRAILTQGHPKCTGSLNFSAGIDAQCCYFNQKFSGFPMYFKIKLIYVKGEPRAFIITIMY